MATRRLFSTSARLRNLRASVDVAAPLKSQTTAQIETTELKALREKAKGPWKNLTNEEKITRMRTPRVTMLNLGLFVFSIPRQFSSEFR